MVIAIAVFACGCTSGGEDNSDDDGAQEAGGGDTLVSPAFMELVPLRLDARTDRDDFSRPSGNVT